MQVSQNRQTIFPLPIFYFRTTDYKSSAPVTISGVQTISDFFEVVEEILLQSNSPEAMKGSRNATKVSIKSPNNRDRWLEKSTLTTGNDDEAVLKLGTDLSHAYKDYRNAIDGREIIWFSAVRFEDNEDTANEM